VEVDGEPAAVAALKDVRHRRDRVHAARRGPHLIGREGEIARHRDVSPAGWPAPRLRFVEIIIDWGKGQPPQASALERGRAGRGQAGRPRPWRATPEDGAGGVGNEFLLFGHPLDRITSPQVPQCGHPIRPCPCPPILNRADDQCSHVLASTKNLKPVAR
jgi:hypothetical protein